MNKKNTLQDLDDFLKQEATTFVAPAKLAESDASIPPSPKTQHDVVAEITLEKVFEDLKMVTGKDDGSFRKKLYDLIIESLGMRANPSPEDKMLINTALYLKSGSDWKNVIREYWKNR